MCSKHIQHISLQSYKYLINTVPIILGEKNNIFLHKKHLSKNIIYNNNTFEGKLACGACSYLLHYYLKHYNIDTKIMKKKNGYGKYVEDHCYLLHNNIIIDPTYRQFFTDYITDENVYSNLLFNTLPFVFVGNITTLNSTYNTLNSTYNTLNNLHINTYNIELETKIDDFWINFCYSNVLDIDNVIDNRDYTKNKGKGL